RRGRGRSPYDLRLAEGPWRGASRDLTYRLRLELVPRKGDLMSWPHPLAEYRDVLEIERTDGRATLTMNRPDRLNALNKALQAALVGGLEDVAGDPAVRSVVLTGAGRGFCAGGELGEVHDAHSWPEASEVGQ